MHTRGPASSIAALVFALGVTTAVRADRAAPIAGSGAAANPSGLTPIVTPPVPPKLPVLVNATDASIPANGSLLLDSGGAHGTALIWLEELGGGVIEGSARLLDGFIVWTPSRALTAGGLYTLVVTAPDSSARDMYPVSVAAAIEPSRPAISASFRLERVDSTGKSKCCASIPGFLARTSACFPTETTSAVRMRGSITATAPPPQLTQFLFRLNRAGDVNAVGMIGFTPLSKIQPLLWPEPADEYCAELSALEIGSAHLFEYDDLEMRCPSKDELGDLSPRPIPLDSARVLSHAICSVPPRDLETEWCDTNRGDCSDSPTTSGCENWDHLCEGGPAPVAPAKLPPRPTTGAAGAGMIDELPPRRTDNRTDAGFGCSIQRSNASSGLAALSCGLAWLLLAARRRSKRRA